MFTPTSRRTPAAATDAGDPATGEGLTAYTVAYIAHVPLEPRSALAEWKDGALTVWTGSQRPFGVRSELAQHFGMPEEGVRVIVPDTAIRAMSSHFAWLRRLRIVAQSSLLV